MSDPSLALQGAIVATLKAAATEAGNNVFDQVPTSSPFPRITLGEGESNPLNDEADEACGYDPTESFIEINVWSRAIGMPQVKRIASDVRAVLHGAILTLSGHRMELPLILSSAIYSRDPDGLTRRARMLLTVRTISLDGSGS